MAITPPVPYTPASFPTIPGAEAQFWSRELRKISQSIATLVTLSKLGIAGKLGVTAISGLPTTSDLDASEAGVFKDTSGGGVYLAYNDAGTIKKVALT